MKGISPLLPLFALACNGGGGSKVDPTSPLLGPCEVTAAVEYATTGSVVALDVTSSGAPFDQRVLQMRRLLVTAPAGAVITAPTGVSVLDATGEDLGRSVVIAADPVPQSLYIEGTAPGPAALELAPAGSCAQGSVTVDLWIRPALELAGHALTGFPHFSFVDAFNTNESVSAAFDVRDFPDRVGLSFDAYVVAHRSPAEWAANPALTDVADGPLPASMRDAGRDGNQLDLWLSDLSVPSGQTTADYDVVLDFGQDGQLDPGDVIDGGAAPGFTAIRDLAEAGPYPTQTGEHSTGFWTTMRVYAPATALAEPAPLVVISHGNGHDYTWYDYLGEHLASWGYVVISHRNDTQPGVITAATTTLQNTETFLRDWPTLGLSVDVDPDNIAWIGHSRGGEGIVIAYKQLVDGSPVSEFDDGDVKLLLSIAPTNFEGPDGANPKDASFHILSGSCDGDVTGGPDSGLLQYYRMFQRGTGDHWVTYVQGADHNDFNCCGDDDSQWGFSVQGNPPVIGRARVQEVAKSYILAMLEHDLRGTSAMAAFLERSPEQFKPIAADAILSTQAMPAAGWVLDDFQSNNAGDQSSSGGAVTQTATLFGEGTLDDGNSQLSWSDSDQTNGMTWSHNDSDPERGAIVQWGTGEDVYIEWEVPAGQRDWTGFRAFSFRTCQGTRNPMTVALGDMLSYTVALVDGAGNEVGIDFAAYGRATEPYARAGLGNGVGWVNEFQTIALPLVDFGAGEARVNLTDVAAVRFRFGSAWGSPQGRAGFDDLQLLE